MQKFSDVTYFLLSKVHGNVHMFRYIVEVIAEVCTAREQETLQIIMSSKAFLNIIEYKLQVFISANGTIQKNIVT